MNIEKYIKLKEQERIVRIIRRYGLTLFWQWFLVFVLITVPFFFMFWLFNHDWWGQALFFTPVGLGILLLIKTIFVWQRNILIITTHRIVDIDQRGFFQREISKIAYDQIEDISGKIKGFFGTIFRFGSVYIQTGNGKVQIIVDRVKQPAYVQEEIHEMRDRFMSRYVHNYSEDVAGTIEDQIYELELEDLYKIKKAIAKRIGKLETEEEDED